jgi:hypothetical protein
MTTINQLHSELEKLDYEYLATLKHGGLLIGKSPEPLKVYVADPTTGTLCDAVAKLDGDRVVIIPREVIR